MDTHYLFLNKSFQEYVEDENKILIDDNIVKAISFNVGISGITAVLVDAANLFGKRALNKNIFKIRTRAWEIYELRWRKDSVDVTNSSNKSVTEIIPLTRLQKYANNDLFVNVVSIIKPVKSELWLKKGVDE